jgi:MFS family permease
MLLAFTLAFLVQSGLVQLWHVYVLALGLGIVSALDFPTQQAFLGDLSGMHMVRRAVNLNAMFLQVSRIIGPAVAGFVIARYGTATTFWLNGLSFVPVIVSLLIVRSHQVRRPGGFGNPISDFASALRFVGTQPRLQDLLILVALITFFGLSVLNIMPAFATEVLGGDAQTLGYMLAASGAGALVSVIFIIPFIQSTHRTGLALAGAAIWMGIWLFVGAQMRVLPLAAGAIFLASIGAPAVIATALGLTQLMAPNDMRARLVSLVIMVSFGMQPLSSLYVGFTAQALGVSTTILINGVLMIIGAVTLLAVRAPLRSWSAASVGAPAPNPGH